MLCALTVRTLKPGTFDQFRDAFMRYDQQQKAIAPFVDAVGADGIYEIVEDRVGAP